MSKRGDVENEEEKWVLKQAERRGTTNPGHREAASDVGNGCDEVGKGDDRMEIAGRS